MLSKWAWNLKHTCMLSVWNTLRLCIFNAFKDKFSIPKWNLASGSPGKYIIHSCNVFKYQFSIQAENRVFGYFCNALYLYVMILNKGLSPRESAHLCHLCNNYPCLLCFRIGVWHSKCRSYHACTSYCNTLKFGFSIQMAVIHDVPCNVLNTSETHLNSNFVYETEKCRSM